ncbi:probable serine/threonine-protein kinase kinX isoform X2 [Periplaneta americana]|uniref:probable serine/threonine-protein kinase kinX isoform X2 n=1 Tax=Periplaneta americana TaxID=6978 RepID=UPI0037E8B4AD
MISYYFDEFVSQGHALTSEVNFEEDPVAIPSPVLKRESEERNFSNQDLTDMKEEYEDQSHDLTTEVKFEEDPEVISLPVVKREPEERNFLDQHVTGIKEEYVNQRSDLLSEVKFEEDPFAVVKREPEEDQSDLHKFNEEPRVEVTAEDKIFIERTFRNYGGVLHSRRTNLIYR